VTNVELVREFWRTYQSGPEAVLARYDEFFTEDLRWRPPVREMVGPAYRGREGYEHYIRDLASVLEELAAELLEVTEIAPDVVRSTIEVHAHGAISRVRIDAPLYAVCRFRDGRIAIAWSSYDPKRIEQAVEEILAGGVPG
jgi:ketosteroid isomerase-like protein